MITVVDLYKFTIINDYTFTTLLSVSDKWLTLLYYVILSCSNTHNKFPFINF